MVMSERTPSVIRTFRVKMRRSSPVRCCSFFITRVLGFFVTVAKTLPNPFLSTALAG